MNQDTIVISSVFTLIFLIAFLRGIVRYIRPYAIDSDTYFHLAFANHIRKKRHSFSLRIPQFLLPGKLEYPYLFHYILSFCKQSFLPTIERYISTILDSISCVTVFMFIWIDPLQLNLSEPKIIMFIVLFATNPAFLAKQVGPRAYQTTPRVLGELIYLWHSLSLVIFISNGEWIWLSIAILSGGLLLLTSKFGAQVLFFFTIVLLVFTQKLILIAVLIGSLLTAVILSKGKYLIIAKGQIYHLLMYKEHLIKVHPQFHTYKTFNHQSGIRGLIGRVRSWKHNTMWGKFTYIIPLIAMSVFAFVNIENGVSSSIASGIYIASILIGVITTFRYFAFVGEGVRYLDYGMIFQYLFITMFFSETNLVLLALYQIIIALYSARMFLKFYQNSGNNFTQNEALWETINGRYPGKVIFPIWSGAPWEIWYTVNNPLVYTTCISRSAWPGNSYQETFPQYPHISPKLFREFSEKYNVGLALIHKPTLKRVEKELGKHDFTGFESVWENEHVCLKARQHHSSQKTFKISEIE